MRLQEVSVDAWILWNEHDWCGVGITLLSVGLFIIKCVWVMFENETSCFLPSNVSTLLHKAKINRTRLFTLNLCHHLQHHPLATLFTSSLWQSLSPSLFLFPIIAFILNLHIITPNFSSPFFPSSSDSCAHTCLQFIRICIHSKQNTLLPTPSSITLDPLM